MIDVIECRIDSEHESDLEDVPIPLTPAMFLDVEIVVFQHLQDPRVGFEITDRVRGANTMNDILCGLPDSRDKRRQIGSVFGLLRTSIQVKLHLLARRFGSDRIDHDLDEAVRVVKELNLRTKGLLDTLHPMDM